MKIELAQPIELDVAAAEGEPPRRTLTGIAVPYNVDANASTGPVRFLAGSLPTDGAAPKLIRDHDLSQPIGIVTARVSTDEAMLFEARISATAAGEEALVLASDGVLDAVSVGVEVEEFHYENGVLVVESGKWRELSLVPFGAFDTARVLDVAASDDIEAAPEPTPEPTPQESEEDTMTEETNVEAAEAPAQIPTAPVVVAASTKLPSVGAYVAAQLRGEPMRVAAATSDTSDVPGVIPSPLVGEVFDTMTTERPIFSAIGPRAMPAGDPFYARKVQQHSAVGIQAAEHDALSTQAYQVAKVQVDKVTLGGYLDLSEQEILYADENVVQLVIEDMAKTYAEATEQWVGDTILYSNSSLASATVTDWTDGDEVITDLYAAAAEIKENFGRMPTHLIIRSDVWASIGAAKDSGGNRIFPYLGPSNAAGTLNGVGSLTGNPLGLSLIVSDDFGLTPGDRKALMLSASCLNIFEDLRGALRVEQPATLSTRLAFRGYVAAANYDISNGCLAL
jgi:HK97 family phage prohead protease/HK97 family phage major capsid protein